MLLLISCAVVKIDVNENRPQIHESKYYDVTTEANEASDSFHLKNSIQS
jgi:hypothetical protein